MIISPITGLSDTESQGDIAGTGRTRPSPAGRAGVAGWTVPAARVRNETRSRADNGLRIMACRAKIEESEDRVVRTTAAKQEAFGTERYCGRE
jgi:hypothetical protein